MKPNPGSDAAIVLGCLCPVLDNHHGEGWALYSGTMLFWITADCPVHAIAYCSVCGHELEAVRPGKWQCNWCEGGRFERLAQAERMMQV